KARDQLRFRFGQIERHAVRLRDCRDEVCDETYDLRHAREVPDVPAKSEPSALLLDNRVEVERARYEDDADEREPQRQLVRDHLRRRAQAAHQTVLRVGRPARERDAVDADGRDAEDVEERDVEARDDEVELAYEGQRHLGAERVDDDWHQRRSDGDDGREEVYEARRSVRRYLLFEDELQEVCEGLEQSARPHAV